MHNSDDLERFYFQYLSKLDDVHSRVNSPELKNFLCRH